MFGSSSTGGWGGSASGGDTNTVGGGNSGGGGGGGSGYQSGPGGPGGAGGAGGQAVKTWNVNGTGAPSVGGNIAVTIGSGGGAGGASSGSGSSPGSGGGTGANGSVAISYVPATISTKTFTYDLTGNLTSKSDVGTYTYPSAGAAQPHGVSSISGTLNTSFSYDANGNMTAGAGRTLTYTSFNIPATIAEGSTTLTFSYDCDHQRFQQTSPQGTTVYINGSGILAEKFTGTGAWQWNDYLFAGGAMVGVHYEFSSGTKENRYFHKDNLGSVAALTDDSGAVAEQDSYDTWGKRRYPNGSDDTTDSITSQTTRGFTSQEELQDVALLHLNGRVYDPYVGRFTSADPLVGEEFSTQGWNRYSYVGNNPLRYTDPSGMCFLGCFWKSIFRSPIFRPLIAIAAAATFQYEVYPALAGVSSFSALSVGSQVAAVGLSGGIGGAISTGTLKGALIGAAEAEAFYEVGNLTDGHFVQNANGQMVTAQGGLTSGQYMQTAQFAENVAGHALVGGIGSVAAGGTFQSGFLASGFGALPGPYLTEAGLPAGTAIEATVGGFGSVLGGGKFENGAVTGAFGYLYNGIAGRVIGRIVGTFIGGVIGGGPEDVPADVAGGYIGGEIGSNVEDALTGNRITVLGNYPDYVDTANQLGANYFNVPADQWNAMSPEEQWSTNQQFLDAAIARGDNFRLATPPDAARPGSFYERELQYLTGRGYEANSDGTQLIRH